MRHATLCCVMTGSTAIAAVAICNECGVYVFQFNVLQLILRFYSLFLKKVHTGNGLLQHMYIILNNFLSSFYKHVT
jgi:hypothetical protein